MVSVKKSPIFPLLTDFQIVFFFSPPLDTMESSGLESACLAGLQACRSTLGAWPSPPAAHSNSLLGNHVSSSSSSNTINPASFGSGVSASQISMGINSGLGLGHPASAVVGSGGAVGFPGLMTPCSDNDNSNMSSDCGSSSMNPGGGQNSFSGGLSGNVGGMDGDSADAVVSGKGTRQNQVGSIHLHGENIVSLIIDNKVGFFFFKIFKYDRLVVWYG